MFGGAAASAVKPILILYTFCVTMTAFLQNSPRRAATAPSPDDGRVARVLEHLRANVAATTEDQIHITEVPAPPFHEGARASFMKKLLSAAGLRVDSDAAGNVIAEFPGASEDLVMVVSHLDT